VTADRALEPYVPRLVVEWLRDDPAAVWREVEGSLAFVDISGFTALTERLARKGKVGAEELSDILNATFTALLEHAYADGAGLVKWGGDAMLLLFEGEGHSVRAAHAAVRMREELGRIGTFGVGRGRVVLRMSVGIHSGSFHFSLVGDPAVHRELIVAGPAATRTAEMEVVASADEVVVSSETAALLPVECVGVAVGSGFLLVSAPSVESDHRIARPSSAGLDLEQVVPPAIRRHLVAARGVSEHRRITVAFVAFTGTDQLYVDAGPAALAAALDEAVRAVQAATQRTGVTFFESDIDRDGGKIMLTAGAPVSAHGDEERMLRAARSIVEAGARIAMKVGVNRGPVFAGDFGPAFRRTYSVKGDAVNLAARLLGKAEAGQVVATRVVVDRSTAQFRLDAIEPFTVKGKSELVEAVRVGEQIKALGSQTTESPLVGRENELRMVREQLEHAQGGHGRLVLVSGEPGIGKSRLVVESLREVEARVLHTSGDVYETATAYWPFRSLLRDLLDVAYDGDDATVVAELNASATRRAPQLTPWIPLIASVMNVSVPATVEVDALAEEFRRERLEEATTQLMLALAEPGCVMVFDDVHLLDDASASLLARLARDSADHALLIIATRRELDSGFRPEPEVVALEIRPAPLDDAASRALLRHELDDRALTPHDIVNLVRRAGGNPLFLRGLVQAARSGEAVDSLPETVEALVTSQIDRLAPEERAVLRFASVLGMSFREVELAELLEGSRVQSEASVVAYLGYFVRREGDGYRFDHQLIRDTAYEGLPYRLRRELHGRAGDLLERTATDPHDVAELLSLHFLEAGRPESAWSYARKAGERAAEKYAYGSAEEMYSRALIAASRLRTVNDRDRADVLIALGEARRRVGRGEEALESFRAARVKLAGDPTAQAGVLAREASVQRRLGSYVSAMRSAGRGLKLLVDSDSAASALVRSELDMICSGVRATQSRYREALEWARQADVEATRAHDVEAGAHAAAMMHVALLMLGTPDRRYGELALERYEAAGDRLRQSEALNNLALMSWTEGRGVEALDEFRRAHDLAASAGDAFQTAATAANVGDVLLRQGHLAEAEVVLTELLPDLQALCAESFEAVARRGLALAQGQRDAFESARAQLVRARESQERLGEPDEMVETDAVTAFLHVVEGSPQRGAEIAHAAAVRAKRIGAGHLLPMVLRIEGAARADLGEVDEARDVLEQALELSERDAVVERGFILAELARVALLGGDDERATHYESECEQAWDLLGFVGTPRFPRV